MTSHKEETVCEGQEHENLKGKGQDRQRLKHVDGDVPIVHEKKR